MSRFVMGLRPEIRALSLDDAPHRQENHEARGPSFETPLAAPSE
jgi:hypothetical protein